MRNIILTISIILIAAYLPAQSLLDGQIRTAVEQQLQRYPKSTLQDIYKNLVQERFGSEHLIEDTARVGAYLDYELSMTDYDTTTYYESIGLYGNYYRVNLYVVKKGLVPRNVLFQSFLQSAQTKNQVTVEEWSKEWAYIDSVIATMHLSLANYSRDRKDLKKMLSQGHYAVHHSKVFEESYHPHYRIVRKDVFERNVLPLLNPKVPTN